MKTDERLEPNVFVIFGGAGDLTRRKLMPALFDLFQSQRIPAHYSIVAVDRVDLGEEHLRKRLHDGVNEFSRTGKAASKEWNEFAKHVSYLQGDFKSHADLFGAQPSVRGMEKEWGAKAQRIFYMATPPFLFGEIPTYLNYAGLAATGNGRESWSRSPSATTWLPRWL